MSRSTYLVHILSLGVVASAAAGVMVAACSATDEGGTDDGTGANASSSSGTGGQGGALLCPRCDGDVFVDCEGHTDDCAAQDLMCVPDFGCAECDPDLNVCVGNAVHDCADDGTVGELLEECDVSTGITCEGGECLTACEVAEGQPSNVGCTFWAVDLDQQDALNDPASAPWGVALSNAGEGQANVTIEYNEALPGEPLNLVPWQQVSVPAGTLLPIALPTRELDCGLQPNDYYAPGTCLSSRAYRITSSAPIVVYQFNVFENAYSNDASLLLPQNALGLQYRVIGWNAGHPVPIDFPGIGLIVDRSYVTVVGTAENTTVTVRPSWRIRGNPPIDPTPAGGEITATLGPFDVLNLETDDGLMTDDEHTIADLSGTLVFSNKPVAVFTGVESTGVPYAWDIPTYPGWGDESCCLDHLEEQLFPMESIGTRYVVTRSPVRSTSGYREPDIIRFVGAAEAASITTTLPPPDNAFTLQPGEVRTTYAQDNFTATADTPFQIGQLLISQGYIDGPSIGDPALTVFAPVDQYRTEYVILTPGSWSENWVVISAATGSTVTIDGAAPSGCITEAAGEVDSVAYESQACPLTMGVHSLSGDQPFGIVGYGYGSAGSYAFVGGADVKQIYDPPPPPR